MISLCITHRVDEDISWVEDLYAKLLIYNKGETWDLPYPYVEAPKIKNEVDTYLRGIIDSYDQLHKFRWIFLLKPNCQYYYKDVVSFLSVNQYNQISDEEILNFSDNVVLYDIVEFSKTLDDNQKNILNALKEDMFSLGINLDRQPYNYGLGSSYMVPTHYILAKSKEWWICLYNIMMKFYNLIGDEVSNIFEVLWPLILSHPIVF